LEDPTTSCTAGRNGIDRRPKRRGDPRWPKTSETLW
jgi:hypothetical protein